MQNNLKSIRLNNKIYLYLKMQHKSIRDHFCEIGRRIWQQGLSPGTGGNISTRVENDKILISPSLSGLGFLAPEDLCLLDLKGNILEGKTKPSSEYKLHLYVYNRCPNINCVIHAHSPFASGFSVSGEDLNTFLQPETLVFLGIVPFVPYGTPSTDELPEKFNDYLDGEYNTFLLENHGVLCIGEELDRTYFNLETLENLAKVQVVSKLLGGAKEINKDNLKKLVKLFNVDLEL
jgi:L-fuculose-phosphate aldolase